MLARAPGLDIFSQSLIIRDAEGWQITEAGLALLAVIEKPVTAPRVELAPALEELTYSTAAPLPALIMDRRRGRRRRRRVVGPRRPAA